MPDSPYSILVVDDSETYRTLLRRYLDEIPCSIHEAGDGEDAVEMFADGRYDLVIMDIIMPLMDGVDAITAIREIETERHIVPTPILTLSGEDSVATCVECLGAGANRMLIKPTTRQGLVEAVSELLGIKSSGSLSAGK